MAGSLLARVLLCTCLASVARAGFKAGCPSAEDASPCVCYNSPYTVLQCEGLTDSDALADVFVRSAGHHIKEVRISSSALQFLPHGMFAGVSVRELHLTNVTLVQLFDESPSDLDQLDVLHIENAQVFGGLSWDLLQPMKRLRLLTVYFNAVPYLDAEFADHVTHDLQQITFYGTQTSSIAPGTFADFKSLDKVAIDGCELTTLTRDAFPVPFNVRVLHFNNNRLRYISDDFFSDMPRLRTVSMRDNRIAAFPSAPAQSHPLDYFLLEGNPLICDCRMRWLVESKAQVLTGACDEPGQLKGKQLVQLTVLDLRCKKGT